MNPQFVPATPHSGMFHVEHSSQVRQLADLSKHGLVEAYGPCSQLRDMGFIDKAIADSECPHSFVGDATTDRVPPRRTSRRKAVLPDYGPGHASRLGQRSDLCNPLLYTMVLKMVLKIARSADVDATGDGLNHPG